jgi:hypothetical protein
MDPGEPGATGCRWDLVEHCFSTLGLVSAGIDPQVGRGRQLCFVKRLAFPRRGFVDNYEMTPARNVSHGQEPSGYCRVWNGDLFPDYLPVGISCLMA